MSMEIRRGTAENVVNTGKRGTLEFNIGDGKIVLHPDLTRGFNEGDEVIVAGYPYEGGLRAMALRNLTQDRTRQIDSSNYILVLGVAFFFFMLGFVQALQATIAGETSMANLNTVMSVAGLLVTLWVIVRVWRIRRAGLRITYGINIEK